MEKEIKVIEEDIEDMEEDCKKINCIAFLDLIRLIWSSLISSSRSPRLGGHSHQSSLIWSSLI